MLKQSCSSADGCREPLGVSRKRFLGDLADEPDAALRDAATAGACALACAATVPRADVVRVHDARTARHALAGADAILRPLT